MIMPSCDNMYIMGHTCTIDDAFLGHIKDYTCTIMALSEYIK